MTYRSISQNMTLVLTVLVMIAGVATLQSCKDKEGCTDPNAINYDSDAEEDDGSCKYEDSFASDTLESDIESATTLSSNTYVCGDLDIEADVVVEKGVTLIMCNNARLKVNGSGSFKVQGTANEEVLITGEVETPGYWEEIEFNSNNPDNMLKHAKLEYGGNINNHNNSLVWLQDDNNAQLTVQNTTFQNSKGFGLSAESGTQLPDFSNNTFNDNGTAGISIPSSLLGFLDGNTDYDDDNGQGDPYIYIRGNDITTSQTWSATNAPYLFKGDSDIDADVTVEPGTEILMANEARIVIEGQGSFNAEGTSSDKITIVGEVETSGYWDEIEFNSNNPQNVLRHVELAYGGGDVTDNHNGSTIWVQDDNNAKLTIENSTVRNSSGWGMSVESGTDVTPPDSSSVVSQNTFTDNGQSNGANCTGDCAVIFF